jgi:hypothetical protein
MLRGNQNIGNAYNKKNMAQQKRSKDSGHKKNHHLWCHKEYGGGSHTRMPPKRKTPSISSVKEVGFFQKSNHIKFDQSFREQLSTTTMTNLCYHILYCWIYFILYQYDIMNLDSSFPKILQIVGYHARRRSKQSAYHGSNKKRARRMSAARYNQSVG